MSWETVATVLGSVSVLVGAVVFLGASIGLLRFPDLYVRSSATGTAAGLGVVFVFVGAFLLHPSWSDAPKVVLAVILQFASSAIGAMAIARSGFLSGAAPTPESWYSGTEFTGRDVAGETDDRHETNDEEVSP